MNSYISPYSVFVLAALSVIPSIGAYKKGRSFWGGFMVSLVISPIITTIVVLFLRQDEEVLRARENRRAAARGEVRCSACIGLIPATAQFCPRCRSLQPATTTSREKQTTPVTTPVVDNSANAQR